MQDEGEYKMCELQLSDGSGWLVRGRYESLKEKLIGGPHYKIGGIFPNTAHDTFTKDTKMDFGGDNG
jgi:hypothetical protein